VRSGGDATDADNGSREVANAVKSEAALGNLIANTIGSILGNDEATEEWFGVFKEGLRNGHLERKGQRDGQ